MFYFTVDATSGAKTHDPTIDGKDCDPKQD